MTLNSKYFYRSLTKWDLAKLIAKTCYKVRKNYSVFDTGVTWGSQRFFVIICYKSTIAKLKVCVHEDVSL